MLPKCFFFFGENKTELAAIHAKASRVNHSKKLRLCKAELLEVMTFVEEK